MTRKRMMEIPVPLELQAEMDKYPDQLWSSAAREGIDRRLAQLSAPPPEPEHPGMARLRKQKEDKYAEEYRAGYIAGEDWALETSHYITLNALASSVHGHPEDVMALVSLIAGQKAETYPYSLGFVSGAKSIYDEV